MRGTYGIFADSDLVDNVIRTPIINVMLGAEQPVPQAHHRGGLGAIALPKASNKFFTRFLMDPQCLLCCCQHA